MKEKQTIKKIAIFMPLFMVLCTNAWATPKKLTYAQAFERAQPHLTKELPEITSWVDDEHYIEIRVIEGRRKWLKINARTASESIWLDASTLKDQLPKGFDLNRSEDRTLDGQHFLFNHQNDLYYFATSTQTFKKLSDDSLEEKNPKFSPNGRWIAFTRDNDLFALDINNGSELRLTHDGSETILNGYHSWVYYEEIFNRQYRAFWWSPNSVMIAFFRYDDSGVPLFPLFKADGVHGELEWQRYPKAGDPNPKVRLGIAFLPSGKVIWVDTDEWIDDYIAWPKWTPDSKQILLQWMNRNQDQFRIYRIDPLTGKKTAIYQETNQAWVDFYDDLYVLENNRGFLLRSSIDGQARLYLYDLVGKLKKQLTRGDWQVKDIARVDEKNQRIFFHASLMASPDQHLCCVDFNGKHFRQLTQKAGFHMANISPAGGFFIDSYSNIHEPRKMELFSGEGQFIRLLGDSKTPLLDEYQLGKVELFTIPSTDGYHLPAIWILPPDFDGSKKYPVILSIYGGPNSATVRNTFRRWGDYYLAQQGIILISVDHRGSGHFGKRGVTLMHRNLGKWEMHDYIQAVKWLRQQPFVDSTRIGITGGSYGGFVTCMALTYGSDYFTHGIAEYSVTDYHLYDSIYTERYMDTPAENPQGYAFTVVASHAPKYKGKLLITHGNMDDNVHMQNTLQLIDTLQNLNKDFELMIYNNERHGVRLPKAQHAARTRVLFWLRHFFGRETLE